MNDGNGAELLQYILVPTATDTGIGDVWEFLSFSDHQRLFCVCKRLHRCKGASNIGPISQWQRELGILLTIQRSTSSARHHPNELLQKMSSFIKRGQYAVRFYCQGGWRVVHYPTLEEGFRAVLSEDYGYGHGPFSFRYERLGANVSDTWTLGEDGRYRALEDGWGGTPGGISSDSGGGDSWSHRLGEGEDGIFSHTDGDEETLEGGSNPDVEYRQHADEEKTFKSEVLPKRSSFGSNESDDDSAPLCCRCHEDLGGADEDQERDLSERDGRACIGSDIQRGGSGSNHPSDTWGEDSPSRFQGEGEDEISSRSDEREEFESELNSEVDSLHGDAPKCTSDICPRQQTAIPTRCVSRFCNGGGSRGPAALLYRLASGRFYCGSCLDRDLGLALRFAPGRTDYMDMHWSRWEDPDAVEEEWGPWETVGEGGSYCDHYAVQQFRESQLVLDEERSMAPGSAAEWRLWPLLLWSCSPYENQDLFFVGLR